MRTLLILIIAGFALLLLGSPDKLHQASTNFSNLVSQLPDRASQTLRSQQTSTHPQLQTDETPSFAHAGEQADIPASEVLNQPITPETEIGAQTLATASTSAPAYGHQDQHSMEEIHAVNISTLEILDRISTNNR